jgi:hypothetical protein
MKLGKSMSWCHARSKGRFQAPCWCVTVFAVHFLTLRPRAARRLQKRFPSAQVPYATSSSGSAPAQSMLHPHLVFLTGGAHPDVVAAKAYSCIAAIYLRQNRGSRAINALVLSLKLRPNPDVRTRLQQLLAFVSEQASDAAGGASGAVGGAGAPATTVPAASTRPVPDVEDIVSMHMVSRYTDKFHFECTGCGECCRSADHIFLSSFDLFNMSRARNLEVVFWLRTPAKCVGARTARGGGGGLHRLVLAASVPFLVHVRGWQCVFAWQADGVTTTRTLRVKFREALVYTTKDLMPVGVLGGGVYARRSMLQPLGR